MSLTVSVIVPSFRRSDSLRRCLDSLADGTSPPDEIVVVCRPWDGATIGAVEEWRRAHPEGPACRWTPVRRIGQPAALNAGVARAAGDVIAFTDDDVVVDAQWMERLRGAYGDPEIGGVGGRDIVYSEGRHEPDYGGGIVGRVTWFGRLVGNHHCDDSRRQFVDLLKGANMSFRRECLVEFDVMHIAHAPRNDADVSLAARRRGAKLLYDPAIFVNHHVAPRAGPRGRDVQALRLVHAEAHDQAYMLAKHLPRARLLAYLLYVSLIGFAHVYGVAKCVLALTRGDRMAPSKLRAAVVGTFRGLATYAERRGVASQPPDPDARS